MPEEINPTDKYDWDALKLEFMASEVPSVKEFIRHRLGTGLEESGNVKRQTFGWAEEKKAEKQRIVDEAQKELFEKLKVPLEDVLANKKVLFELDREFLRIATKIAFKPKDLTDEEKDFYKIYYQRAKDIWTRVQVELGQPTNIEKLGAMKEGDIGKLIVEIVENNNGNTDGQNQGDEGVQVEREGISDQGAPNNSERGGDGEQ